MLGEDGSCMSIGEECAEKTLGGREGGEGISSCGGWEHFGCVRRRISLLRTKRNTSTAPRTKTGGTKEYIMY